ncbi:Holliday junction resolvase RuvX [Bacteroidetes/Chlorobi group bacterium Naka2016]|jgi:putative Holliday junction resolvase|nr:MAG: Holliday junction resolvase RuvX [Bacteroidetes/Chlorobi group bacterium Naka2016]
MLSDELKGKRLASVDFGFKRLGVAVCDEMHISVSPSKVFNYSSPKFWDEFLDFIQKERISALVIGYPFRNDNKETDVTKEIEHFINQLKTKLKIPIFPYDESYSTIRAEKLMLELGKKKKDRRKKENKDLISAAIILRDFILENNL